MSFSPHTALILIDHGSRVDEANRLLEDVVRRLKERGDYPIAEPAHMELAQPDLKTAFARCVEQGARRVAVVPWFLGPGRHSTEDIPRQTAEAAAPFPGVPWSVADPLGLDDRLIDVAIHRALEALPADNDAE